MAPNDQAREAYMLQQAYRAGQAQKPFYAKQGISRIDVEEDGAYVEAGEGGDHAQVFIPKRTEYVTEYVKEVQKKPLFKRCSTYLIILLVLMLVGGVAIGVAVHEVNKSNSYSNSG